MDTAYTTRISGSGTVIWYWNQFSWDFKKGTDRTHCPFVLPVTSKIFRRELNPYVYFRASHQPNFIIEFHFCTFTFFATLHQPFKKYFAHMGSAIHCKYSFLLNIYKKHKYFIFLTELLDIFLGTYWNDTLLKNYESVDLKVILMLLKGERLKLIF